MRTSHFKCRALGIVLAVVVAACGGPSNTVGGTSVLPQSVKAAVRAHRGSGSLGDLVYVITAKGIKIVSYPDWAIVGTIPGTDTWYSVCSDPNTGNVFAVATNEVDEFAHGGTAPIATLTPPSGYADPTSCAVDPTTGNLAVVVLRAPNNRRAVLVYPGGSGTPTAYTDKTLVSFTYPAYDGAGNLFIGAGNRTGTVRIAELKVGTGKLISIKFAQSTTIPFPQKIQWDGTYLVFQIGNGNLGTTVNQIQISGTTATVVNTIQLNNCNTDYFWIYDGSLLSFFYPPKARSNYAIARWAYPAGGNAISKLYGMTKGGRDFIHDLTVSVEPSASRARY